MQVPDHRPTVNDPDVLRTVPPALERYTTDVVLGDLWKRPQLSARDRGIVTLAVMIARNQSAEMPRWLDLALDSGVEPGEILEIITHLAFYSGWANAMSAVKVTNATFERRGIDAAERPPASAGLLPIDEPAEARREAAVTHEFASVAPGLLQFTRDVVFRDLWLRPGLAPRDRCLVTVSAVVALGQVAQLAFYLNRALDNGLTRTQLSEVMTHLAFYTGWSYVFTALPVVKDVFEKRSV